MKSNQLLQKTKTILLDLGGVVFNSTGKSNESIRWPIISKLNYRYGHQLNLGEDYFSIFMQEYNALTKQNLSGEEFLKSVFDTLEFNQSLINLLQPHFNIIIVSDNYRENIEYIAERYQFNQWSTAAYYSFDFKMVKGDPAFFVELLNEIDLPVESLLLIDDSSHKLDSAKSIGIKGICYKDVNQIHGSLKAINWL